MNRQPLEKDKITRPSTKRGQQQLKGGVAARESGEMNAAFQSQESEEDGHPTSVTVGKQKKRKKSSNPLFGLHVCVGVEVHRWLERAGAESGEPVDLESGVLLGGLLGLLVLLRVLEVEVGGEDDGSRCPGQTQAGLNEVGHD